MGSATSLLCPKYTFFRLYVVLDFQQLIKGLKFSRHLVNAAWDLEGDKKGKNEDLYYQILEYSTKW